MTFRWGRGRWRKGLTKNEAGNKFDKCSQVFEIVRYFLPSHRSRDWIDHVELLVNEVDLQQPWDKYCDGKYPFRYPICLRLDPFFFADGNSGVPPDHWASPRTRIDAVQIAKFSHQSDVFIDHLDRNRLFALHRPEPSSHTDCPYLRAIAARRCVGVWNRQAHPDLPLDDHRKMIEAFLPGLTVEEVPQKFLDRKRQHPIQHFTDVALMYDIGFESNLPDKIGPNELRANTAQIR